jgi:glycosyltransferase involved in cell wall biosynthesis
MHKNKQEPATGPSPFRIGVWCDYGYTLTKLGGIGVLVYNLVEGLLALDEPIEVVMLVHDGGQHYMEELKELGRGRLTVVPEPWQPPGRMSLFSVWVDQLFHGPQLLLNRLILHREASRERLKRTFAGLVKGARRGSVGQALGLLIGLPIAFSLVWGAYGMFQIVSAAILFLMLPFKIVHQGIRELGRRIERPVRTALQIAESAQCDVWIIPYFALKCELPKPSVLFIHDLVTSHYPEGIDSLLVRSANKLAPVRAAEATICACMSAFIRDTDLLGTLALPAFKVRMVRYATPRDFPKISAERAAELKSPFLVRPYVFMPSGIRGYKNQRILIEALQILQRQHDECGVDLVLTGEGREKLPRELSDLIEKYGLEDHVHVLGHVDRQLLAALYMSAFAVVFPSLYEQGSFPVYEGLHFGCPVACSDIPPFREQCASMSDAMLYFDPHDPEAVAQTILMIRDHREEIRARQREASRSIWQRTWRDVARDWLPIFKEAVEMNQHPVAPPRPPVAPWPHDSLRPRLQNYPPKVLISIPFPIKGEAWRTASHVFHELYQINQSRRDLTLTLAVHPDQPGIGPFLMPHPNLRIESLRLETLTRLELKEQLGIVPKWPGEWGQEFSYFRGDGDAALRADAWFVMSDQLPKPLVPIRPYGLALQSLGTAAMISLQPARLITVGTPHARENLITGYGIDPNRIRDISPAYNPHCRFHDLRAEPIDVPLGRLVLNVTETASHQEADTLLRALADLRQRAWKKHHVLVMCGPGTEEFSTDYQGYTDNPHVASIRALVQQLHLKEDYDVAFLGPVSDAQLKFLYERCLAVVSAHHSPDSTHHFGIIVAALFGKPMVSLHHPAAEYLAKRFEVPVQFLDSPDTSRFADCMGQALAEPPLGSAKLERRKAALMNPDLGYQRYAERLYGCLLELVEEASDSKQESQSAA